MHANLGLVAYAKVDPPSAGGPSGPAAANELNSGVTAYWQSPGVCDVTLPGDLSLQEPLQEGQSRNPQRDIIVITPLIYGASYSVTETSDFVRRILINNLLGIPSMIGFTIIILRSLISPPTDANGNPTAPA